MMTYKDTTFCTAQCLTFSCHRNLNGPYYNGGPVEDWMPVAMGDFAPTCSLYQVDLAQEGGSVEDYECQPS
jgi:hypothetical protein